MAPMAVGHSVSRKDGIGKATGAALYADDLTFPGMLHGRTIRQFGNSVVVPVVNAIAELVVPRMLRPSEFPLKATHAEQSELRLEVVAA